MQWFLCPTRQRCNQASTWKLQIEPIISFVRPNIGDEVNAAFLSAFCGKKQFAVTLLVIYVEAKVRIFQGIIRVIIDGRCWKTTFKARDLYEELAGLTFGGALKT
jgi:hypothetical protein